MSDPDPKGSPSDLVQALSDAPLPEQAERYYSRLLDRMKDLADSGRRSVYALLLVAACMELLDRAAVVDMSLGPFKVRDLSFVHKVLPVVGGFLIYEICANGIRYLYSRRLANRIIEQFQPALAATGSLPRLVYPLASSLYGPMPWYQDRINIRLITVLTALLRNGSLAVPPLLVVRWYWHLFQTYGFDDVLVWASACFSLGFIVFAALVLVEGLRAGMFRRGILFGVR